MARETAIVKLTQKSHSISPTAKELTKTYEMGQAGSSKATCAHVHAEHLSLSSGALGGLQDGPAQTPRTMRKERAGAKGGLGEDEVEGLQPQQLSLVDASHRACVTDLHWLPGLGINREGRPPSRPASVCP